MSDTHLATMATAVAYIFVVIVVLPTLALKDKVTKTMNNIFGVACENGIPFPNHKSSIVDAIDLPDEDEWSLVTVSNTIERPMMSNKRIAVQAPRYYSSSTK